MMGVIADSAESVAVRAKSPANDIGNLPGLLLRTHETANLEVDWGDDLEGYIDEKLHGGAETEDPSESTHE
jgi:hypothetical protein